MTTILQRDEPVLRGVAKEVPVADIATPKIKKILKDMQVALDSQDDGVAIAAPQIGVPLRIFLVSGAIIEMLKQQTKEEGDRIYKKSDFADAKDIVFINPVITKLSKKAEWMEEGCLSVRYLYGKVKRATKASVTAYDETGAKFERGASGIMAQIYQHETDHLDGVLFIDKAKELEDLPPPPQEK